MIGRYNEDIMKYILSEESTKFLSPQIQNEIIKTIGNHIIRQLIARIKTSSIGVNKFFDPNCSKYVYSIIADETSDISCKEQLSICIRYCTNTLESDEVFLGFYESPKTDAATLHRIIRDILARYGLAFKQLRGQGYDGGSNMAGRVTGLQKRISDENPKALYFHCSGHQLNLAVQDACHKNVIASQAMTILNSVIDFIRDSPKRLSRFKEIVSTNSNPNCSQMSHIKPLSDTRWVLRLDSLNCFLDQYPSILDFLEDVRNDTTQLGHVRARALSHLQNLEKFSTYFALRVLQQLFKKIHPVHKSCQGKNVTAGEINDWMVSLVELLTADALSNDIAPSVYQECKSWAVDLKLDLPQIPRYIRRHYDTREEEVERFYSNVYKDVLKSASDAIIQRFPSASYRMADLLRQLLENDHMNDMDINTICEFYDKDWGRDDVVRERKQWFACCKRDGDATSVTTLRYKFANNPSMADLLPNLFAALVTYIVLPTSSCEAERSFSLLRRLKTYLRSTQSQQRLNNLAVIASHRDFAAKLKLDEVVSEFVAATTTRRNRFGDA